MRAAWPIAFAFALAALGCRGEASVVPNKALGRWVSDDPRYAGRSLLISQRTLIFASGPTDSENFAVRGVASEMLPDGSTQLTIAYGNDRAGDLSLRLRLLATTPPQIQLGDRSERWQLEQRTGRPQ